MQLGGEEEAKSMNSAIGMFRRMCACSCRNIALAGILLLQEYCSGRNIRPYMHFGDEKEAQLMKTTIGI